MSSLKTGGSLLLLPEAQQTAANNAVNNLVFLQPNGNLVRLSFDNTGEPVYTELTPVTTGSSAPVATNSITIDNNSSIGLGNDQVSYANSNKTSAGSWSFTNNGTQTYHLSTTTGDQATILFTGTAATVVGMKGPNQGILTYVIDGAAPVNVDLYAASQSFGNNLIVLPTLVNNKSHTLVISVSGTKNASSSANSINFQFVTVSQPTAPVLPPVMGTPTVTPGTVIDENAVGTGTNQFNYAPTPTQLATEVFSGTTGAAWPGQWTTTSGGGTGGSATQNGSGGGRLVSGTTAFNSAEQAVLSGMTAATDMELIVRCGFQNPKVNQYILGSIRGTDFVTEQDVPFTGYYAQADINGNAVTFGVSLSGTRTVFGTTTAKTFTAGTDFWLRLSAIGSTISWKVWNVGSAEPAAWDQQVTDTTIAGTGKVGLSATGGTTTAYTAVFSTITVTAAPDWKQGIATTGGTGTATSSFERSCSVLNDNFQMAITGVTGVAMYGSTKTSLGKQDVLLDGSAVITAIDAYTSATIHGVRRFFWGGMTTSAHTLKVNQRSDKNASSSGLGFTVESAIVGSSLSSGTYYFVGTSTDSNGNETNASAEVNIAIGDCGTITLPFTVATGAVTTKIYGGTTPGGENKLVATVSAPTATATITTLGATTSSSPTTNPTTAFDVNGIAVVTLTDSSSTGDTNGVVTSQFSLLSNVTGGVLVQDICVSVRNSSAGDVGTLDYPHLNTQTIPSTAPYAPSAQTTTLSTADTYTIFVSYNIGGVWYKLTPVRTLVVTQATSGANQGGTAGGNPLLTTGNRSGLPWNSGSQNTNQDSTQPSTITGARTYMENRGKLEDCIQNAQFINDPTGLDGDFTAFHASPNDSPLVLDMPPGWGEGAGTGSWANIAAGNVDTHFFNMGVAYANYCHASRSGFPVIFRLGWEANGSWYHWSIGYTGNGDTNATYIAGWRRAAQQIMAGATSTGFGSLVVVDWSLSGLDAYWGNPLTTQYPGDDVVGSISLDMYDEPNGWVNITTAATSTSFPWGAVLDQFMAFAIAHGKWMGITEWGLHHTGATAEGGDNPFFISGFYNWMRAHNTTLNAPNYSRVWAELYFQDDAAGNVNSSVWSSTANNNPNGRAAYGPQLHA